MTLDAKKPRHFWRRVFVCGVLGVWLGSLAFFPSSKIFPPPELVISPETTGITEPLRPDGRVDYFAWAESLEPPEMKTDQNAARALVRAFGPLANYDDMIFKNSEGMKKRLYDRLGLDPSLAPSVPFYDSCEQVYAEKIEAEYPGDENASRRTEMCLTFGNLSTVERLAAQETLFRETVAKNSPALDAVADAVRDARVLCFPLMGAGKEIPLLAAVYAPDAEHLSDFGRALSERGTVRIMDGDFDGAIEDFAACLKLGTLMEEHQGSALEMMKGITLTSWARNAFPFAANPDQQPNAEQWRRILALSRSCRAHVPTETIATFDFYTLLDIVQYILRSYDTYDPNVVMKTLHEINQQVRDNNPQAIEKIKNLSGRFPRLHRLPILALFWREKLSQDAAWMLTGCYGSTSSVLDRAIFRSDCQRNLHEIGVALQLYRAEHDGQLPPAYSVETSEPTQEAKDGQRAVTTPAQTTGGIRKPLHSWRVLILPYFGDEKLTALYHEIKLDEPWDSEYNRQFHERMPEVYLCPTLAAEPNTLDVALSLNDLTEDEKKDANQFIEKTVPLAPGQTGYTVLVGEHTLFGHDGIGRDPTALSREHPEKNIAQMILVTERISPACWMCPDAEMTEADALVGIGNRVPFDTDGKFLRFDYLASDVPNSFHPSGVNALFANGASNFLSSYTNENIIQERVTGSASN